MTERHIQRTPFSALAAAALMLWCSASLAEVPRFSVSEAPPLPPALPAFKVDGVWVNPLARNAAGAVLGSIDPLPFTHQVLGTGVEGGRYPYEDQLQLGQQAVVYQGGLMTLLGTQGRNESRPVAINDQGQVAFNAGTYVVREYLAGFDLGRSRHDLAPVDERAFLYEDGVVKDLGTLGGSTSRVTAINARGDLIGQSQTAGDQKSQAFLYRDGQMIALGLPEDRSSSVHALNDDGDAIGTVYLRDDRYGVVETVGFVFEDGVFKLLDLPDVGRLSPSILSAHGTVAGIRSRANADQAFVYRDGRATLLPPLAVAADGSFNMSVDGVNDRGEVVGSTDVADTYLSQPYLYSDGQTYDLRDLIGAQPFRMTSVESLGEDGSIVVQTNMGRMLLSRMTAVPEPTSASLMLLGLIGLARMSCMARSKGGRAQA